MSGKVKMRCPKCGKSFKPVNNKQVLCPDCAAKERQQKLAAKAAPASAATAFATEVAKPRIVGPGANILVPGATPPMVPVTVPPDTGSFGVAARERERTAEREAIREAERAARQPAPPASPAPGGPLGPHTEAGHPGHPKHKGAPQARTKREPTPPKPRSEPTPPFTLTDELRERIEARYLELASPVEFDGIRTQIAGELGIPKSAVKRAVAEYRARSQMPSWWELQSFTGTPEDLERIRERYVPLLPVPPIGIHRQLAQDLQLEPLVVYHGIRRIRAEMRLPQYNPLDAHRETAEPAIGVAAGERSGDETTA